MVEGSAGISEIENATMRSVTLRVLPFLMICYFVAFIDRVNAGFAAFQMNADIGLTPAMFGLGGGLFFVTYVLFEVPSNLAGRKFGANIWISRIMITWGLISAAMAFVVGPWSYCLARMLLGAAEAGFFPGVILYLTDWFPSRYRARIVSYFMVALPISSVLGSPLSVLILQMDGLHGLRGWQWLFILEALPAVILGLLALRVLTNSPKDATWLTVRQKEWLARELESEHAAPKIEARSVSKILLNKYVLIAALVYAGASGGSNGLSLWLPQIIKSHGVSNFDAGLLNTIPFALAAIVMVAWGRHSDQSGERMFHTLVPLLMLIVSLVGAIFIDSLWGVMTMLCIAVTGTYAFKGPFWALASSWLSASSAAAGIAQINAIGNLGGFIGTYSLGLIKGATDSFTLGMLPIAVMSTIGCAALYAVGRERKRQEAGASAKV